MFINSYVYLKSFHVFSTLYPEINILGEISKHFKFMETHVARNHVNIQMSFQCHAKCHFNMYWSMPYSSGQKLSKQKKLLADSPYTSFCEQGNGCLMIQMPQGRRFLSRELPILCKL